MNKYERIQDLIKALQTANSALLKTTMPMTIEEKQKLLDESASIWDTIMHKMPVEKRCETCAHCVLWEFKHCCSAREMAPIPFEIQNKTGGCSKWEEKDFIPF